VTAEPSRNVGPNSGGGPFDHTTGCSDWAPDPTQPVLAGISNSGVTLYTATPTSTPGQAQTCGAGSSDLPTRIPFGAVNPQDPTQLAWPATQGGKPGVWDVLSVTTNTLTPNVGTGTYTQGFHPRVEGRHPRTRPVATCCGRLEQRPAGAGDTRCGELPDR